MADVVSVHHVGAACKLFYRDPACDECAIRDASRRAHAVSSDSETHTNIHDLGNGSAKFRARTISSHASSHYRIVCVASEATDFVFETSVGRSFPEADAQPR